MERTFKFTTNSITFKSQGSFANLFLLFLQNKRHRKPQTFILLYNKNGYSVNQ